MASRGQHQLADTGSRAAAFRLERLDGGESSLEELLVNGPILLVFFKITCPVCQLTLPYLNRINSPSRLAIYGISQNDAVDTREFAREFGVDFPILLDSEDAGFPVSNAYGISSVPTSFLVERDGTVSRVQEGWQRKEIEWLGAQTGTNPIRQGDSVPEWKAG
jgi:peroxiredoxin